MMADGNGELSSEIQTMQCVEESQPEAAPFFAYRDKKVPCGIRPIANRTSSDEGSSSEESDASGSGDGIWKRRRRHSPPAPRPPAPPPPPPGGRRNNIWGQVLAEQSLSEDIRGFCGVQASLPCNERAVESYRYWSDNQPALTRRPIVQPNRRKRKAVIEESDDSVADTIADALEEPKRMLIGQVVSVIGRAKAMELLENTKEVEANGGMTIMNGSRRRTPGGVFFQLLKSDPEITAEQIESIFEEERKFIEKSKKRRKAVRRKVKTDKLKALLNEESPLVPLVPLPTAAELVLNRCKPDTGQLEVRENELEPEEGEIVDDDDETVQPDRTDVDMA